MKRAKADASRTGLCPDCGKTVSRLAMTCPHCGRPLSAGDIQDNPEDKPWYNRTMADNEKIRRANGTGEKKSGAGTVIMVVIGILIAFYLISQIFTVQITGTITPMK